MRLANLLPLALSCVALCATAETTNTTRALSLRDSIDLALRNNLDLQIERANTDIARFGAQGAYGAYDPAFSFSYAHQYDNMPLYFVPDKANPDFPYKADREMFGSDLKGKLPVTGLSYDLGVHSITFHNVRTDFNLTPEQQERWFGAPGTINNSGFPDNFNTTSTQFPNGIRTFEENYLDAGLALRQPLLKDSWIDAERQQIRIARNHLHLTEAQLRGKIMQTITAVEMSYYDLIYTRENVRFEQEALELATNLVAIMVGRQGAGQVTPLEVADARSHAQTVQSDLLAAQIAFLEQQNLLKQLLTDDFNAWRDIDVTPTENLKAVPEAYVRDASWLNALTKRPDILQAKLDLERQGFVVKFNYNQLFPSLDVIGGGGARAADPSWAHAAGALTDVVHPYWNIGAIFSIPLGNRTAWNAYEASKAAEKQAGLRMKKLEQLVLNEVDTASKVMGLDYQRVTATTNAREVAQDGLTVAQVKLREGTVPPYPVMQAQRTLTAARSAEIRALADYNKARAQLAYAEGMTLEKNKIRVEVK